MDWRSFDVLNRSKPAATARSMKYGSVKLRSIKVLNVPSERPSRRSWPLPSRLRSRIEMSPKMPDVVEYPAPNEISPVLCSTTCTSRLVLSGDVAGRGGDIDFLEEAEVLQAILAAPHLRGREGVAFGQTKLSADHLVEGARVARDVDALDIDARSFLHVEGDVDRLVVLVAPDIGSNVDEGVAQRADRVGHRGHRLLDLVGVVPVALVHRQVALERVDIEPLEARRHLDLAELVALALVDRESDEEAVAVGRQLGHRRDHAEVGITLGQVEFAQQLAVEVEPIRIEAIVGRQEAPPRALGGADLAAQRAVAVSARCRRS